MYMARRKVLPQLPRNADDVYKVIQGMNVKTNREEDFCMKASPEENIIMFSCYTNLHFLCSLDSVYLDGTFQFCPKFFYQMVTIHVLY